MCILAKSEAQIILHLIMVYSICFEIQSLEIICLFDLILYVPSTIFQLKRDGSSWVIPGLSYDKCVLLKDHNAVTPVRLEPVASLTTFLQLEIITM